jgi:hypothetical protein
MNEIVKEVNRKKGYRMVAKEVNLMCYTGDAVLTADKKGNLER